MSVFVLLGTLFLSTAPQTALSALYDFFGHLQKGEFEKAKAYCLSYEEIAKISNRPIHREKYQAERDEFFSSWKQDTKRGLRLKQAHVADVLRLPADRKMKQPLVMALLRATFSHLGQQGESEPISFTLVLVESGWKFFFKVG